MEGAISIPFGPITSLSRKEWDNHQGIITNLYIDENLSLPRLMQHMREVYNLHATPKMFKLQFTRWKLEKKLTKKRAMDAVGRNIAGVSSTAECLVESEKRREYLRRLPKEKREEFLTTFLKPSVAEKSTNTAVSLISPLPPTDLRVPECYFNLLNSYIKGSLEAQSWPRDRKNGLNNEDVVPAWCSSIMTANWILGEGKEAEAHRFLLNFVKQSSQQLLRQDPLIFPFLYTSVLTFAEKRPDIAQGLLQAIYSKSEGLPWAPSHPLRLLIKLMLRLGVKNIIANASHVILAYINIIHETLGAPYPIVQDMLSDAIWRLLNHNLIDAKEVICLGRRMVVAAELQKHDRCKDHLNLKMALANAYLETGNTRDARSTATEIIAAQSEVMCSERMMPSLHMCICRIDEAEGRDEEAIASALRAVVASIEIFGAFSDWTVNTLIRYSQALEKAGRTNEAQRVMEDRDLTIEKLSSTFSSDSSLSGWCVTTYAEYVTMGT